MKFFQKTLAICLCFLFANSLFSQTSTPDNAQNSLEIKVDSDENEPLPGASVFLKNNTKIGGIADENGIIHLNDIPNGVQTIIVSYLGYQGCQRTLTFPRTATTPIVFSLKEEVGGLEEITISTNRSGRDIEAIPTRIEAIKDEVEEGVMMAPATASHVLTHVAGVQVQTTSSTSATANIRIQGLGGRYTQILQDGFPLYGGFAGSLGILQIPPVDLQQVEFLKGPASTLYGSGAIAGVVNLISKKPEKGKDETTVHLNASQIGQFDANVFVRQQLSEQIGFSVMASNNLQKAIDVNNDGYTDLPQLTRFSLNTKLFWNFTKKTKGIFSLYLTDEQREGGDILLVQGRSIDSTHFYKESNKSNRVGASVDFTHKIDTLNELELRSIFSVFKRQFNLNEAYLEKHDFSGFQNSSFSEFAWKHNHKSKNHHTVAGLNLYTNLFLQSDLDTTIIKQKKLNEGANTLGLFGQHDWDISKKFSVEGGLRIDCSDYLKSSKNPNFFVLPRVAALYKINSKWSSRFSAGLGYRLPSVFEQETEQRGFHEVLPLNGGMANAEYSQGANLDFTFRTPLSKEVFLSWNQLFFYTKIDNPIYMGKAMRAGSQPYQFEMQNLDGYVDTKGSETNIKVSFGHFNLYAGYVYTDPVTHVDNKNTPFALTSKHVIKTDFVYEIHGKWLFGIDTDYRTQQTLASGRVVPALLTGGFLVRYTYKGVDFYFNTENIGNVRQSQLDGTMLSAPYNTPQYTEVWAPQEGFVYNFGIRANLTKATGKN